MLRRQRDRTRDLNRIHNAFKPDRVRILEVLRKSRNVLLAREQRTIPRHHDKPRLQARSKSRNIARCNRFIRSRTHTPDRLLVTSSLRHTRNRNTTKQKCNRKEFHSQSLSLDPLARDKKSPFISEHPSATPTIHNAPAEPTHQVTASSTTGVQITQTVTLNLTVTAD
jgi:hypothetical protein